MANPVNTIREGVEMVRGITENIKEKTLDNIRNGLHSLRGSGHVVEEAKDLGRSLKDIPVETGKDVLRAVGNLLTLHPIQATKDIAGALGDDIKRIGNIMAKPVSGSIAIAEGTGRTVAKAIKLPVTGSIAGLNAIKNGRDAFFNAWGKLEDSLKVEKKPKGEVTTPIASAKQTEATPDNVSQMPSADAPETAEQKEKDIPMAA